MDVLSGWCGPKGWPEGFQYWRNEDLGASPPTAGLASPVRGLHLIHHTDVIVLESLVSGTFFFFSGYALCRFSFLINDIKGNVTGLMLVRHDSNPNSSLPRYGNQGPRSHNITGH